MAAARVLKRKGIKAQVAPPARPKKAGELYDYPVSVVGRSAGGVLVVAATDCGAAGVAVAKEVLSRVDFDASTLADLFGVAVPAGVVCVVSPLSASADGSGGAYHYDCSGVVLYCDCCASDAKMTSALFVAELVEVMEAAQARGWGCGDTNGEGLSRCLAEAAYPGTLDSYETASAWLDGGRPNYVDRQQGTDTDDLSNGCSCLFLWWLTTALGYPWGSVVGAAGPTLAATYQQLTGHPSAWQDFTAAVAAKWPAGAASGVTTDDPWQATNGPPPGPGPGPGPGPIPGGLTALGIISPGGSTPDGSYLLLPVPSDVQRRLLRSGLSAGQWSALVQAVLTALLTALPGILGAGKPKAPTG